MTLSTFQCSASVYKDTDKLKLTCDTGAASRGCDPGACAIFAGTFDRIQRQIFNQSCALSGCHDSQTPDRRACCSRTGASYDAI